MQEIDYILFAMVVSATIILLLSALFIAIIFRHLKAKETHKNALFESIYITQEEERGRIAMELHDDLGSTLLGLKLKFDELLHSNEIIVLKHEIANSLDVISEAIQTTRLTSQTLMPQTIKNYGISSALIDLTIRYKNTINICLTCNIKDRLSQIIEINMYRIISELITNTIKHAKASNIGIEIKLAESQITIEYSDNGIGFDYLTMLKTATGLGINNIKNRVDFLKGNILVNKGITNSFKITIPIN